MGRRPRLLNDDSATRSDACESLVDLPPPAAAGGWSARLLASWGDVSEVRGQSLCSDAGRRQRALANDKSHIGGMVNAAVAGGGMGGSAEVHPQLPQPLIIIAHVYAHAHTAGVRVCTHVHA